jgi:hypothetical protein
MKQFLLLYALLSTPLFGQISYDYAIPMAMTTFTNNHYLINPTTNIGPPQIDYAQPFFPVCFNAATNKYAACSSLAAAMQGLNTYLTFSEKSGLIAMDSSGNGHNAVISTGGTQVWTPQGLQLNSETATIAGVGGIPTVGFCAYFPAAGATTGPSLYSTYTVQSNGGQNGVTYQGEYYAPSGHSFAAWWPGLGILGGAGVTAGKNSYSGNHCVEFVTGTTSGILDRIYVDGREIDYRIQGSTYATLGGGALAVAASLTSQQFTNFTVNPILYSVWNAVAADSPSTALSRMASETARLTALGVNFNLPAPTQSFTNQCAVQGSSIVAGFEATSRPASLMALNFPCTISDFGLTGDTLADEGGQIQDLVWPLYSNNAKNILYSDGATNELYPYGATPQQALQNALAWTRKAHAQGWKTVISTAMSRGCNTYLGTTGDSAMQAFNALLIANGDEFDWVNNVAANPQIGATGASQNLTYFNSDSSCGTHPTNAGQAYLVAGMKAGFEGVFRNPITNTVVSRTQLTSDQVIVINAAGATTQTLMDANVASFNSKGKLCMKNLGTGTVTLATTSSQTIDGVAPGTLATGSTICVVPYVAVAATGGANWIKVQP